MAQPALTTPVLGFPASQAYLTAQLYNPLNWIYGQIGNPNGWVNLSTLGTFQNGATAATGSAAPQAADYFLGGTRIRFFRGVVDFTGVTTSSYTFFTFTTAPVYERDWASAGTGGSSPFRCFLSTAGNWGITGQAAGITAMSLDDFVIVNPPGTI